MQTGRKGRLDPAVGFARNELANTLNRFWGKNTLAASGKSATSGRKELLLVGCSGGPDSLALAALAAHFVRRQDLGVGAVIVDHQLQEGSAQVAQKAKEDCLKLGLSPVLVKTVTVQRQGQSLEMAARTARYRAFAEAVAETEAAGVLLAHTLDDQAETVLLGLARGSGTRSLAGMPEIRQQDDISYLRPLLKVRRSEIEQICAAEGLEPWYDPTNQDQSLMRAKVRHKILPFLEQELGGDVATSLARTAAILGPDASYLDARAQKIFDSATLQLDLPQLKLPQEISGQSLVLDRQTLMALPEAERRRVLALAVKSLGGHSPGFERLQALDDFAAQHSIAGPLQLSGHISAWRARPSGKYKKTGVLILARTG